MIFKTLFNLCYDCILPLLWLLRVYPIISIIAKPVSYHCYDCLDSLSCNLLPTSPLNNAVAQIFHIKSDPLQHWVRATAGVLHKLCNRKIFLSFILKCWEDLMESLCLLSSSWIKNNVVISLTEFEYRIEQYALTLIYTEIQLSETLWEHLQDTIIDSH